MVKTDFSKLSIAQKEYFQSYDKRYFIRAAIPPRNTTISIEQGRMLITMIEFSVLLIHYAQQFESGEKHIHSKYNCICRAKSRGFKRTNCSQMPTTVGFTNARAQNIFLKNAKFVKFHHTLSSGFIL